MPNLKIKSGVKHKIGWCYYCGWTHGNIKLRRHEKDGTMLLVPVCELCDSSLRNKVACEVCGEKSGDKLWLRTIQRKKYSDDEQDVCSVIVAICQGCNSLSNNMLIKKINIPEDICLACQERFKCYTFSKG